MKHEHEIIVIGSGFAGIGMGVKLLEAGFDDFVILEKAARVGGTWRDNHYPGAACDVESHFYSFSFEPNPTWTRMFAPQGEIWSYLERCVEKYGLTNKLRFSTTVTRAEYDERDARWTVTTENGDVYRARYVIAGCGGLSRPKPPDIAGIESFTGKMFHSARWDDSYSLEGKRVAVIGTGASAIQIVPSIAPSVAHLDLYQRTPPWVIPRSDRAITDREQAVFHALPVAQRLVRTGIFLRRELLGLAFFIDPRIMRLGQKLAKGHLFKAVSDPALREKLLPNYVMGCKRILISNDYYPALARPNVDVITEGIRAITPRGVATVDGREREVDAIILATGFEAAEQLAPFETVTSSGKNLDEEWLRAGGEAYLGTTIAGFPNLFMIVGPNTGLGHGSMVFMIEAQVRYITQGLKRLRAKKHTRIVVRKDAQDRYNQGLQARLAKTVWATGGCASWYKTRDGKNTTLWPGFMFEYALRLRRFDPESYDLA
jgi:cation diffusion facilitator CzcD-associated flavoprotein CzcO